MSQPMKSPFKKIIIFIAVCWALSVPSYALNPQHEKEFRETLDKLTGNTARLNDACSAAFAPGATKEQEGMEEVAWRARDLQEKTLKLNTLCKEYWKNESEVVGVLDQWHQNAKHLDEAMVYSPVAKDITDLWKSTKEMAVLLRDYVEEIPSAVDMEKVSKDFSFEIVKVGRYVKKQILREKLKEFIGSDDLDKWPFANERRDLDPKYFGEDFQIIYKVKPLSGGTMQVPLKVRFEYKFASHTDDGSDQNTLTNLKGGSYDFLFKNLGEDFKRRGKVIHWRASLLLSDKVVAQKKSPMWTVVSEWAQK